MNDEVFLIGGLFFLIGVLGSFLAGLLGIGGGVIYILAFSWFLDGLVSSVELPRFVVANSAAVIFISTLYGLGILLRQKQIRFKEVLALLAGGIPASVMTTRMILYLDFYNKTAFSIIFLGVMGLYFLFSLTRNTAAFSDERTISYPLLVGIGGLGGFISAAVGLGGGMVVVPLLLLIGRMSPARAARLSLSAIPFLSLTVVLTYAFSGAHPPTILFGQWKYFLFPAVGALSLGALLGMPWGLRFSRRLSPRRFNVIFLMVILLVFIKTLIL